jgi:long-chain acyl-CoA synthetase
LLALGVRKGEKASLYLNNSIEFAEIYFALSKMGVIVVPINFRVKGKELLHIIRHSGSTLMFFNDITRQNVELLRMDLEVLKFFCVTSLG